MGLKIIKSAGIILTLAVVIVTGLLVFLRDERGGLDRFPEIQIPLEIPEEGMEIPDGAGSLKTTYKTINYVQKHYLDPTRVDPRQMFIEAARAVQLKVAEVIVREDGDALVVGLGPAQKQFDLTEVKTPWILLQKIREVFTFVRSGVPETDVDFQEVEYAAINGMLQTLDPHTSLLPPDMYRDMKDKTQGEFGGLGIVISIRDGVLTIISPIDGTPADLAGLKAGDQVIKIGEASTVSMPLNDAVNLMRGKPGTAVTLWIMRKGWEEARPFEITRAIIQVQSVESEMLSGSVGYVRIKDFQANTATHMMDHLARLEAKGARGLVLDMRNNPGGLLKAAIEVSDIFLKKGVIVTTAGQGPSERDVRRAKNTGNEPGYPVVVLVNSGSASASEIVAGALKNHQRALLVGQRTFGKGSVQVLYDYRDGSALKITSAQYLTPGDLSIQSVGVVPHVEFLPMRADDEMMDLKVDAGYRESDLQHHIEEEVTASLHIGRPDASLRYLWTDTKKKDGQKKDDKEELGAKKEFVPDFEINLARDLVVEMSSAGMETVKVDRLSGLLEQRGEQEIARLAGALNGMGVDWSVGPEDGQVRISQSIRIPGDGPLEAGETSQLVVSVTNEGEGTVYRLLATTRSDLRALDDKELVFGLVGPGQTMERTLDFKVPKDIHSQVDDVLVTFEDAASGNIPSAALRFEVGHLPKPRFAYTIQMVDTENGNGDGTLQRGEKVKLLVDIENVGSGKALSVFATLKSLSGKEVFLVKGREKLEELPKGERKQAVFEFEVRPGFEGEQARFELGVMDVDLRAYSFEKISYDIAKPSPWVEVVGQLARAVEGAEVFESPSTEGRRVAILKPGAVVAINAGTEDLAFQRIMMEEGRPGWISSASVEKLEGTDLEPEGVPELVINASPELEVDDVVTVVRRPDIRIRGRAHDETRVRNVYIFVGDDKVFYQPNTDSANPGQLQFDAMVKLEKGLNFVTIVAEETPVLDTRKVIAIRRDRVDGMPFVTPWEPSAKPQIVGVKPQVR